MSRATFFPDQSVMAEDLNKIATDFGGASPDFADGDAYAVEELNKITAAVVNAGVSIDNGFAPSFDGSVLTVGEGIAFFADGSKFRLSETVNTALEITDGYIYLQKNADQTVELTCAETEPPENAILLAVLIEGKLEDRRTLTVCKTEMPCSTAYQIIIPNISTDSLTCTITPSFVPEYIGVTNKNVIVKISTDEKEVYYPSGESTKASDDYVKFLRNGKTVTVSLLNDSYLTLVKNGIELR